jgi:hypothetical protein
VPAVSAREKLQRHEPPLGLFPCAGRLTRLPKNKAPTEAGATSATILWYHVQRVVAAVGARLKWQKSDQVSRAKGDGMHEPLTFTELQNDMAELFERFDWDVRYIDPLLEEALSMSKEGEDLIPAINICLRMGWCSFLSGTGTVH